MADILMIASEGLPFYKTGGLGDVVSSLSRALVHVGQRVSIVLPFYSAGQPSHTEVMNRFAIRIGESAYQVTVRRIQQGVIQYIFLDIPELFNRRAMYGEFGRDYEDNAVRFAVFCHAAIELARQLHTKVIHCHDWQTGLIPTLLKTRMVHDPILANTKTVFTAHNLAYQGVFTKDAMLSIGLDWSLFHPDGIEFWGNVNFLKGGLMFGDMLTTVSPTYANEIQTPEYGCGLDGVLRARRSRLVGILNGVDYDEWNPESDPYTASQYSIENPRGKKECKRDLLRAFGLPSDRLDLPLIGMVSRFTSQKGFDLVATLADFFKKEELQLVVLGSGDSHFERLFQEWAQWFPTKVGALVGFNVGLAHKITAGADMFLMPSRYEPCGLNQMYSLRYGTIPIGHATGGLEDTINVETGFKFRNYNATALQDVIREALTIYRGDSERWQRMIRRGMEQDYSWDYSAREYSKVYESLGAPPGTTNLF